MADKEGKKAWHESFRDIFKIAVDAVKELEFSSKLVSIINLFSMGAYVFLAGGIIISSVTTFKDLFSTIFSILIGVVGFIALFVISIQCCLYVHRVINIPN